MLTRRPGVCTVMAIMRLRPVQLLLAAAAILASLGGGPGCGSQPQLGPTAATTIEVPTAPASTPASASASVEPPISSASPAPAPSAGTRRVGLLSGCGCAPCEPIKSSDACTSASDCVPESPCHARSCVTAAHATALPPDGGRLMCTMNIVCKSMDVGRCDCVDGLCALVAR